MGVDLTQKDKVVISHGPSIVEIYYWGATVTSWKVNGEERLFVSSKAIYSGPKAIRGGIPLVFPQFGSEPGTVLPQHGFARVSKWDWVGTLVENTSELTVQFALKPEAIPPAQREKWSHDFKLTYTLTLTGNTFTTTLGVKNTSSGSFSFQSLLHTYFRVKNISNVSVLGLTGYPYVDKVAKGERFEQESRLNVAVEGEVDRVYERVKSDLLTLNGTAIGGGSMVLKKQTYGEVVVWNPWIDRARELSDFGDEEYKEMICVEVGNIEPVTLKPSEEWSAGQTLVAV